MNVVNFIDDDYYCMMPNIRKERLENNKSFEKKKVAIYTTRSLEIGHLYQLEKIPILAIRFSIENFLLF